MKYLIRRSRMIGNSTTWLIHFAVFWVIGAFILNGQTPAQSQSTALSSNSDPGFAELDDLIHYGDLIEVDVVGSTEFDWRGEVTPEGTLGGLKFTENPIVALCQKGSDVAVEIARSYSKFLNEPQVNVEILDRSRRPFAVLTGAVRNPQRFKLLKAVTLKELIVFSGGFSENAEGGIEIRRQPAAACVGLPGEGKDRASTNVAVSMAVRETEFREIRIEDILSGKFDSKFSIHYGDFLIVKSAPPVYVIGNVPRPGRISMSKGLTVGRAVAAAGGLSDKIETADVRVFRRNEGSTEIIELASSVGKAVTEHEFAVKEYDIIEVFGGKRSSLEYPPVLEDIREDPKRIDELPVRVIK